MWGALAIGLAVIVAVPLVVFLVGSAAVTALDPVEPPAPLPSVSTNPPVTQPPPSPPPSPSPAPSPSPPPEPEPVPVLTYPPLPPPHSDEQAWVTVQQAAIYVVEFPEQSGCPAPALLETMAELEPYATAQLQCLQDAWRPALADLGLYSAEIPHYFYEGSTVTSPCGTVAAPAYYCSADGGAIYFGEDLLLDTSWDPIWAKDIIGHEYGHHLQGASGFFRAMNALPPGNETIRRNEIQATCLGFGMLRRDDAITLDRHFYDTLEPHLRSFLDDGTHGSPDSLAYWGLRGFHAEPTGECNTWVVDSEGVR